MFDDQKSSVSSGGEDGTTLKCMLCAVHGLAVFSGSVAILLASWNFFEPPFILAIFSELFQICVGIMVIANEIPYSCLSHKLNERRDYWNRATGYCMAAVVPVVMSFTISNIIGCGMIFTTGILYGLLSFLKKDNQQQSENQHKIIVNQASNAKFAVVHEAAAQEIPPKPAESQEIMEHKNQSTSSIQNVKPIYPTLNI